MEGGGAVGYDDATEVLTNVGWKPWPSVVGDEVFGTLNPTTGELEYQTAVKLRRVGCSGPMYRVRSEQVDLLVAPDHRMWIQRHDTRAARRGEQSYGVESPREILHKRVRYQKTANWMARIQETAEIPATSRSWTRKDTQQTCVRDYPGASFPIVPFAAFLGYYLAEGSVNGHQIILSQNRGRLLDKMADVIAALGLPPNIPRTGAGQVRTQCVALRDLLAGSGHAVDKRVPSMVHNWPSEIIRIFLSSMVEGDGCTHPTSGHQVIYTASKDLADDLQVLAIKAGISANIRVDDRRGVVRVMPNGQRFRNQRVCYVVSLLTRRNRPLVNTGRGRPSRYWNRDGHNDGIEGYEGTIHCVQVPNGLLWVRRNGKPVVSGSA